jgi:oxygen-independent coproporphyrinogen-3 oxidase
MDLILGLEGEEIAEVAHTLNEIEKLDIDNLTIHTLAVKRASKLKEKMNEYAFTDERIMRDMVDMAQERAYKMGMHPYYMYRQKYMSGNLENVGFAKPGTDCIYNIDIMEETHNLIALGAGAVSKRMYYEQKRHARLGNYKSISHYIDNIDSELLKKEDFFAYN